MQHALITPADKLRGGTRFHAALGGYPIAIGNFLAFAITGSDGPGGEANPTIHKWKDCPDVYVEPKGRARSSRCSKHSPPGVRRAARSRGPGRRAADRRRLATLIVQDSLKPSPRAGSRSASRPAAVARRKASTIRHSHPQTRSPAKVPHRPLLVHARAAMTRTDLAGYAHSLSRSPRRQKSKTRSEQLAGANKEKVKTRELREARDQHFPGFFCVVLRSRAVPFHEVDRCWRWCSSSPRAGLSPVSLIWPPQDGWPQRPSRGVARSTEPSQRSSRNIRAPPTDAGFLGHNTRAVHRAAGARETARRRTKLAGPPTRKWTR